MELVNTDQNYPPKLPEGHRDKPCECQTIGQELSITVDKIIAKAAEMRESYLALRGGR